MRSYGCSMRLVFLKPIHDLPAYAIRIFMVQSAQYHELYGILLVCQNTFHIFRLAGVDKMIVLPM